MLEIPTIFAIGITAMAMSATIMPIILIGWRSDLTNNANKVGNEHRKKQKE